LGNLEGAGTLCPPHSNYIQKLCTIRVKPTPVWLMSYQLPLKEAQTFTGLFGMGTSD